MEAHALTTTRTAQYYTFGTAGPQTKSCWLALHGYGQLARYFLRRFDVVAGENTLVAAPEALARFYTNPEESRVGAGWMTREHRLDDIADNMVYLDALYAGLRENLPPECRFTAFGFSQGCATLMRWALHARPPLAALVLYAGSIPEDLPYAQHLDYLSSFPIFLVYGTQDEFLTPERVAAYRAFIAQAGLPVQYLVFEGGHAVERSVLTELLGEIGG